MRFTHKGVPRNFQVPFGPWVIPLLGAILCLLLICCATAGTAMRFGIWTGIGQIIYFSYGFWRSKYNRLPERSRTSTTSDLHDSLAEGPANSMTDEHSLSGPIFTVA